eukprot:764079-Hanusia_phi.AAC.13
MQSLQSGRAFCMRRTATWAPVADHVKGLEVRRISGNQENVILVVGGSIKHNESQETENTEGCWSAKSIVVEVRMVSEVSSSDVWRQQQLGGLLHAAWERAPSLALGPRRMHAGLNASWISLLLTLPPPQGVMVNRTLIVSGGQNSLGGSDRAGHAMVVLGEKIYAIGGFSVRVRGGRERREKARREKARREEELETREGKRWSDWVGCQEKAKATRDEASRDKQREQASESGAKKEAEGVTWNRFGASNRCL